MEKTLPVHQLAQPRPDTHNKYKYIWFKFKYKYKTIENANEYKTNLE